MQFVHRIHADVVVLAPVGHLDYKAAGDFERTLLPLLDGAAGSQAGLVLDFTNVDYISSVSLRVIVIAAKSLRGRGARIAVAGLRHTVAEIFSISRFNNVVEIFPTLDAALAALSPAAAAAFHAGGAS